LGVRLGQQPCQVDEGRLPIAEERQPDVAAGDFSIGLFDQRKRAPQRGHRTVGVTQSDTRGGDRSQSFDLQQLVERIDVGWALHQHPQELDRVLRLTARNLCTRQRDRCESRQQVQSARIDHFFRADEALHGGLAQALRNFGRGALDLDRRGGALVAQLAEAISGALQIRRRRPEVA
jgi:hypothetical protein